MFNFRRVGWTRLFLKISFAGSCINGKADLTTSDIVCRLVDYTRGARITCTCYRKINVLAMGSAQSPNLLVFGAGLASRDDSKAEPQKR